MLRKIRSAIVHPTELKKYRHDSLFKAWLFMLVFALLVATPTAIAVVTASGLSHPVKDAIINESIPPEINCEIIDAYLQCDEPIRAEIFNYGNVALILDTNESLDASAHTRFGISLVVWNDAVFIIMPGYQEAMAISTFDESFHNFDFSMDAYSRGNFRPVLLMLDQIYINYRSVWGSALIIGNVLSALLLFNAMVLLNAFLSRVRLAHVPLKELYVLMTYAATLLYIVMIFEAMIGFGLIIFIILLLLAFRQMSRLTLALEQQKPPK